MLWWRFGCGVLIQRGGGVGVLIRQFSRLQDSPDNMMVHADLEVAYWMIFRNRSRTSRSLYRGRLRGVRIHWFGELASHPIAQV
jgi:hypothetical protein